MMLKTGRVKWYNQAKGYGFISPNDGGSDLYVSRMSIANTKNKSLLEGQQVEFTCYHSVNHGLSAADVIAFH
ncbi:cold-shock protein [Chimaeribacter arupi]|uniref:Cold-shock protein n=2 Tax=Yersiniaceae TaxID=1903411 RepID=A0A2N5ETS6_9GAMM|nr:MULTISPECIES: cold-shock protein [Yersiniaceae]MBS0969772.1 cold-shock protein [Nissabacter archeti]MDV5141210.1 cold-shock protein [Chimaeribacter arupi]PLR39832.1 cold-shock protein [Chimaeribacter arupi]PLR53460.1 cold-shock protein [Chimaeribacter arupi]PLR54082.1 cold-shock protein [Chimaeribacter arupi]